MDFNEIFTHYDETFQSTGDVFESFKQFTALDLGYIDKWLELRCKNDPNNVKNNKLSSELRQTGNQFYKKNNTKKSLEFYTRSLCTAVYRSEEYGLALANRSAVLFSMNEYKDCLKDIEECLKSKYPVSLRPKVYLRKAECHYELGETDCFNETIKSCTDFIQTNKIEDTEKVTKKLNALREVKIELQKQQQSETTRAIIPTFENENKLFAYASPKIKLCYNKEKGRHVKAATNIQTGDALFIEKAFIFAPVFSPKNKELNHFKCYNCLNDTPSCIPCKSCTLSAYCDETCRNTNWNEFHKWECVGMQGNIWYDLGIAFPAFRCILKGINSGFKDLIDNPKVVFGDKLDNYPYFRGLVSNIDKIENITPHLVMAAIVIKYLENYTDFFENCLVNFKDSKEVTCLIGGLVALHVAQLSNNSSVIEHWDENATEEAIPNARTPVACGIFPSVSMMNHSCCPNVTNFFIGDTIVVKALHDIKENEEVFNCYGIDYRTMNRQQRRNACASLYYFECNCCICSDSNKEIDKLDWFKCLHCPGKVFADSDAHGSCGNCGIKYKLDEIRGIYSDMLANSNIKKATDVRLRFKTLLSEHNYLLQNFYYDCYNSFKSQGDFNTSVTFFLKLIQSKQAREGKNSRSIAKVCLEEIPEILDRSSNTLTRELTEEINKLLMDAYSVLSLYYPENLVEKITREIKKQLV